MKIEIKKEERVTRLSWNSNSWNYPSGKIGKSELENEGLDFGYEEWLNSPLTRLEGVQFGFLEGVNKRENDDKLNIVIPKIYLYSRFVANGRNKGDYYIGYIENVKLLTKADREIYSNKLYSKGVVKIMNKQLEEVGVEFQLKKGWLTDRGINISFAIKDMFVLESPAIISTVEHKLGKDFTLGRYSLFENVKSFQCEDNDSIDVREDIEDDYYDFENRKGRRPNVSVIARDFGQDRVMHDLIQELLYKELKSKNEKHKVLCEKKLTDSSLRPDILEKTPFGDNIFEIKTHSTLRKCVRAALGQIMEYQFWVTQERAKGLFIVSHFESDPEIDQYLEHLTSKISVPVKYLQVKVD